MKKKEEFLADEFRDGVRLFNPSKPHGTVYADGFAEAKWDQEGILYRGDRSPITVSKKPREATNASGGT